MALAILAAVLSLATQAVALDLDVVLHHHQNVEETTLAQRVFYNDGKTPISWTLQGDTASWLSVVPSSGEVPPQTHQMLEITTVCSPDKWTEITKIETLRIQPVLAAGDGSRPDNTHGHGDEMLGGGSDPTVDTVYQTAYGVNPATSYGVIEIPVSVTCGKGVTPTSGSRRALTGGAPHKDKNDDGPIPWSAALEADLLQEIAGHVASSPSAQEDAHANRRLLPFTATQAVAYPFSDWSAAADGDFGDSDKWSNVGARVGAVANSATVKVEVKADVVVLSLQLGADGANANSVLVIGDGVRLDISDTLKPCAAAKGGLAATPEDACPAGYYRGPADAENRACGGDLVFCVPGATAPAGVSGDGMCTIGGNAAETRWGEVPCGEVQAQVLSHAATGTWSGDSGTTWSARPDISFPFFFSSSKSFALLFSCLSCLVCARSLLVLTSFPSSPCSRSCFPLLPGRRLERGHVDRRLVVRRRLRRRARAGARVRQHRRDARRVERRRLRRQRQAQRHAGLARRREQRRRRALRGRAPAGRGAGRVVPAQVRRGRRAGRRHVFFHVFHSI